MSKVSDSRKTSALCDLECDLPILESQSMDPDNFDVQIERMYIQKFRQQRQKIQSITKQFEEQRSVLEQKVQYVDTLEKKVVQLSEISIFKKKYEDLSRDHKILEHDYQKCKSELQTTKNQLSLTLQDKMIMTKQMRTLFKDSNYKYNQQISQLRQLIDQKQRLIESVQQKGFQQSRQLSQQIRQEQNKLNRETQQWNKLKISLDDQINQLNKTINAKDLKIKQLEEQNLNQKRTIDTLSYEIEQKDNTMVSLNQEYKQLYQKMKFHIRGLKKQLFDKQEEIITNKQNIVKLSQQIKRTERKNLDLSENLKITARNFQESADRSQFQWQQEKRRYVEINNQFKSTIQELVKAKGHLAQQNQRLLSMLRQKDSMQKLRNQIKRNQFCQIDRVQRIVRKI